MLLERGARTKRIDYEEIIPFEDLFSILKQYQKLCLEDMIAPSMLLREYGCCTEIDQIVNIYRPKEDFTE